MVSYAAPTVSANEGTIAAGGHSPSDGLTLEAHAVCFSLLKMLASSWVLAQAHGTRNP